MHWSIVFSGVPDNLLSKAAAPMRRFCLCGIMTAALSVHAAPQFLHPLDLPVLLAGTFGELRSNHFHSGIDFKTQGTEGHAVHAVADGHISRIAVSAGGYGQALYIEHDNGYTSVYAHLSRFTAPVTAYVREQQYDRQQFAVDLYPTAGQFKVKAGDIIAYSGNTGGSSGPHLHFEIRHSATQKPANPLLYGFTPTDNQPPVIRRIGIYPMQDGGTVDHAPARQLYTAYKRGSVYSLADHIPTVTGDFVVGIETVDTMDGATNQDGPYSLQLYVDSIRCYKLLVDSYSFDDTRAINSLIDYATYVDTKSQIYKLYVSPNNLLSFIKEHRNRGVVSFSEAGLHQIRVVVGDVAGNTSEARFQVRYSPLYTPPISDAVSQRLQPLRYDRQQRLVEDGLVVEIPARALYEETALTCAVTPRQPGAYAARYRIHDPHTPLHKRMSVSIRCDSIPARLRSKALLVYINQSGTAEAAGGKWDNGFVQGNVFNFGTYTIGVDTIPPAVRPITAIEGRNLAAVKSVSVRISDEFSGISLYQGAIDGQWVLFAYDAKNSRLTYTFDEHCPATGEQHTLQVKVCDAMDNTTYWTAHFIR